MRMQSVGAANAWRSAAVSALVRACFSDDPAPISAAAGPLKIRCAFPDELGFRTDDLRWHRDRLCERADATEIAIARNSGTAEYLSRKVSKLDTRIRDLWARLSRLGAASGKGDREAYKRMQADATAIRQAIAGIETRIRRMREDADAFRGAAALLGDVIDSRITRKTEAITTGAGVVVAA